MFYQQELRWAAEAEALKPCLNHELLPAADVVCAREEPAAWQGWTVDRIAAPEEIYGKEQPRSWEYTFDFGRYCVGFPVLEFEFTKRVDAPFRLELKWRKLLMNLPVISTHIMVRSDAAGCRRL